MSSLVSPTSIPPVTINEYLKCKVCSRFAVTPIYNCCNGHVCCGICYGAITSCIECKLTLGRNYLLDHIFQSERIVIPCRNVEGGCHSRIVPSEMSAHMKKCDFRSLRCAEVSHQNCPKFRYTVRDLFNHWKDYHKIWRLEPYVKDGVCSVTQTQLALFQDTDHRWRITYFEFEGRTFFIHMIFQNGIVHIWATMMGSDAEAKAYNSTVQINLSSGREKTKKPQQIQWTFPVHSMQYYDVNKAKENGEICAFYGGVLKSAESLDPLSTTAKSVQAVVAGRNLTHLIKLNEEGKWGKWTVRVDISKKK